MPKIIVAVYDEAEHARQTAAGLGSCGLQTTDYALLTADGESDGTLIDGSASGGDLESALRGLGLPEDEAQLYSQGLDHGVSLVVVRAGETQAEAVAEALQRHPIVDIDALAEEWASEAEGGDEASDQKHESESGEQQTLQSVEERLHVGKRVTQAGQIRVHTRVEERPVEERVTLHEEEVHVERRPVDRKLSPEEAEGFLADRTVEVTATREQAVIAKEARVVEEVVIGKTGREREEVIKDTVRRTTLEVVDESKGRIDADYKKSA